MPINMSLNFGEGGSFFFLHVLAPGLLTQVLNIFYLLSELHKKATKRGE